MLLSRLKNRNKTAPAPVESSQSSSNVQIKSEHNILTKRDTWTGPELEAVVITPPHTPTLPPSPSPLQSMEDQINQHHQHLSDPLADLPELPRNRLVLPPLEGRMSNILCVC